MAKKIVLLCIMTMFIMQYVVCAENIMTVEFHENDGSMTISGKLPSNARDNWVTIKLLDPQTRNIVNIIQTTTDCNLYFEANSTFEAGLDYNSTSPLYLAVLNYFYNGGTVTQAVYYQRSESMQLVNQIGKAQNAQQILNVINGENAISMLGNMLNVSGEFKDHSSLAARIYQKVSLLSSKSTANLKNAIREAMIFDMIASPDGTKKAVEFINSTNKEILGILKINKLGSVYSTYASSSDKVLAAINNNLGGSYQDGNEFNSKFAFEVLLQTIKNADTYLQVRNAIQACADTAFSPVLDTKDYMDLTDSKKIDAETAMMSEVTGTETAEGLRTLFNRCVANAATTNTSGSDGNKSGSKSSGKASFDSAYVSSVLEPPKVEPKNMFTDIDDVAWATESINYLAVKGIISGRGQSVFEPHAQVNREEFVKLVLLSLGLNDQSSDCDFDDVLKDSWCYPYVASAYKKGIINGISNTFFGVGSSISREDMAVIAYRCAQAANIKFEQKEEFAFADNGEISAYAKEAVQNMYSSGIIHGVGENRFSPKSTATRSEAAKIVYELLRLSRNDTGRK